MVDNITKLKQIVKKHQYQKINGVVVDVQSANVVLRLREALKQENQKKYDKIINTDLNRAVRIAWSVLEKTKR